MSTTPIYAITEWEQNQEQPHVTSNTAWRILEAMSSRTLASKSEPAPPSGVDDGDVYFIDGAGTGVWSGHSDVFAVRVGADWHYVEPRTGWIWWIEDEAGHFWIDASSPMAWNAL